MRKESLQVVLFFIACCLQINVIGQENERVTVTGQITSSEDDFGIPGVNILEVGTTNGTVTDVNGNYSLQINKDAQITVSYIGYKTETISVNGRTTISVALQSDTKLLEDIVVVGYGTQKKSDVTGAVSSISAEELTENPVASVDQALQGKMSGITIINNSGDPGGGVSVRIRGEGTIGNSDPLYVIDGVPVVNNSNSEIPLAGSTGKVSNPIANLNPNDIESIDILKDASAAAIYGVRGANGVVIITTKRGKSGTPVFSFDAYTAFQEVKTKELLKAKDYADLITEMYKNAGTPISKTNDKHPYNLLKEENVVDKSDWQKEFFKTAVVQNYNFGVSGGSENTDYSITGGYYKNTATTIGSGFDRYSIRINSNYKLGRFKFGESISLSRTANQRAPFVAARSQIRTLIKHAPTVAIYNPKNDGGYGGPGDGDGYGRWNTIGLAKLTENFVKRNRLIGNIYAEYEIVENLKYKLNVGLDAVFTNGAMFTPSYHFSPGFSQPSPQLREYNTVELSPLIENTLSFNKEFGDHNISILAGFTQQEYSFSRFSVFSNALQRNDLKTMNTSSASAGVAPGGFDDGWAIRSLLGRVNYSFQGKYLFTGNIRRDGSSRFSEENRYGVFPSFSVGWMLSKESFLENNNIINSLKLRLGWGELGNQEIPPYGFQSSLIISANYVFGSKVQSGVTQSTLANQNLKWETTTQTNIGIDAGFLDDKIQLNLEYFIKETKDIILRAPLPGSLGIPELPLVNAGNIENSGLEVATSYRTSAGDLKMKFGINATFIKNTVKSLGIGLPINGRFPDADGAVLQVIREGETINSFIGHVTDGIFQTDDEVKAHAKQPGAAPGDIRFKDLNNDGVIDDKDKKILGDPVPDIAYGFTAGLSYKGIDMSIFFQGVEGVDIYNGLRYWSEGLSEVTNHTTEVLNRWKGKGTSNTIPRAVLGDPNKNRRPSDRFLEDGSFLRLKNVTIGYAIPGKLLENFGNGFISSIRVYVSGQNLLTFTKYTGYDPEIGTGFNQGVNVANQGVDYGIIPQPKTYLMGLQIKF